MTLLKSVTKLLSTGNSNEQEAETTPTRHVIPPISLVAIVCLTIGLGIGYGWNEKTSSKYEIITIGDYSAIKINKHTGETWVAPVTSLAGGAGDLEYEWLPLFNRD
jgi:hypothetical protein